MAVTQYLYNPQTQLWYPTYLEGTGDDIHTVIDSEGGVATPPPYVAEAGEPLLTTDYFLAYTGASALPVTTAVWSLYAVTVSNMICGYCRQDWRIQAVAVPLPVQMACAFAIRDLIAGHGKGGQYKSYSGGDYSYTLADDVKNGDLIAPYAALLNQHREYSIYA